MHRDRRSRMSRRRPASRRCPTRAPTKLGPWSEETERHPARHTHHLVLRTLDVGNRREVRDHEQVLLLFPEHPSTASVVRDEREVTTRTTSHCCGSMNHGGLPKPKLALQEQVEGDTAVIAVGFPLEMAVPRMVVGGTIRTVRAEHPDRRHRERPDRYIQWFCEEALSGLALQGMSGAPLLAGPDGRRRAVGVVIFNEAERAWRRAPRSGPRRRRPSWTSGPRISAHSPVGGWPLSALGRLSRVEAATLPCSLIERRRLQEAVPSDPPAPPRPAAHLFTAEWEPLFEMLTRSSPAATSGLSIEVPALDEGLARQEEAVRVADAEPSIKRQVRSALESVRSRAERMAPRLTWLARKMLGSGYIEREVERTLDAGLSFIVNGLMASLALPGYPPSTDLF